MLQYPFRSGRTVTNIPCLFTNQLVRHTILIAPCCKITRQAFLKRIVCPVPVVRWCVIQIELIGLNGISAHQYAVCGCNGDSHISVSGVKQGCPLSPTLLGVFIDALEGRLSHRAAAGVSIGCESGDNRLLSRLLFANNLALAARFPSHLQALIYVLTYFSPSSSCTASQTASKSLRQLIRVSPSTDTYTAILLAELDHLSLQRRWLGSGLNSTLDCAAGCSAGG